MPLFGVSPRTDQVQRHVWFITDDPAVVSGSDIKDIAGTHLDDAAIVHCYCGTTAEDEADVFDLAFLLAEGAAHVFGPLPSGIVRRSSERQVRHLNGFVFSFGEGPNFVGLLEALQHHIHR